MAGAPIPLPQTRHTTVLLTAFGPFPGVPVNATMRLVPELAERAALAFPDVRFVAEMLATEWLGAPRHLAAVVAEVKPDLILHFGVSSRARGFEIEQRAHNACRSMPDAAGVLPRAATLRERRRRRAARQPARAAPGARPASAEAFRPMPRAMRAPTCAMRCCITRCRWWRRRCAIAGSASCMCRLPWRGRAVPIAAGSAPVRSPGRRPWKGVLRSSPAASAARLPKGRAQAVAGARMQIARQCSLTPAACAALTPTTRWLRIGPWGTIRCPVCRAER